MCDSTVLQELAVVRPELRHPGQRVMTDVLHVAHEPVLEDHVGGRYGVLQADLLALGVVAAVVRDRHLVDAQPQLGDLGRDLRLESEPVAPQGNSLERRRAKELVARLHVGQVEIGGGVGQQRQQPVGDHVPEQVHASRSRHEARAVDDVRLTAQERAEQTRNLARVVFEIGILDDDELAGRLLDAGANGGPLPLVLRLEDETDVRIALGEAVSRISREPSVDPSSTTMISLSRSTAATRRTSSRTV